MYKRFKIQLINALKQKYHHHHHHCVTSFIMDNYNGPMTFKDGALMTSKYASPTKMVSGYEA